MRSATCPPAPKSGRAYSFYHEKLSGLSIARMYTKYIEPDGKSPIYELQRQVFGKKQEDAVIFTTNEAYDVTYRGAKPLTEQQIQQFRDTTLHDVFYILRERIAEPGFEVRGKRRRLRREPARRR